MKKTEWEKYALFSKKHTENTWDKTKKIREQHKK
jgi:hypothetical protein